MPAQNPDTIATALVVCADQRGIVAALAQTLYGHGANILDADQHTDTRAGTFFQRIRFDTSELHTDKLTLEHALGEVRDRFDMQLHLRYASAKKRIAIFVSKVDHCLHDLLWRHKAGELDGDLVLIVSNHDTLEPIAKQFEIPFHLFPITKDTRAEQEQREIELLEAKNIDVVVLARYMQILSDAFVSRFPSRVINIHHSFLPAFIGGNPYKRAYTRGVKLIGATAHYATAELDEGPIIEQDVVRCSHRDGTKDLIRRGRDLEKMVLARAVRWHLEDRVLVYGNKTVVFD